MYIDGDLASSIPPARRQRPGRSLPARTVFPDILDTEVAPGLTVVDPTRFVTKLEYSRRFPEMPYLTVRPGWMAGEYFRGYPKYSKTLKKKYKSKTKELRI